MESPSVDAILQAKATADAARLGFYVQIVGGLIIAIISGFVGYLSATRGAKIGAEATMKASLVAQQRAEESAEKAQQRAIELQREEWLRLQNEQDKSIVTALLNELILISTQASQSGRHLHQGYSWIMLPCSSIDYALHNLRATPLSRELIDRLVAAKAAISAYNSRAEYSNSREPRGGGYSDNDLTNLAKEVADRNEELYSTVIRLFGDIVIQPGPTASVAETTLAT